MPSNIDEVRDELEDFGRDMERTERKIDNTRSQLITYIMLLRRLHLPEDAEKAISILIRMRMTIEQATRAAYLMMAASGPMGWAMALGTMGIAVVGTYDIAMEVGGQ